MKRENKRKLAFFGAMMLLSVAIFLGSCGDDPYCSDGWCGGYADPTRTCAPPYQLCGGMCIDAGFTFGHCGGCGQPCLSGQVCIQGRCQRPFPPCGYFELFCNNQCVDILTNNSHCGGCNIICDIGPGKTCQNGRCHCLPGFIMINGKCRYLGCDQPGHCSYPVDCVGPHCVWPPGGMVDNCPFGCPFGFQCSGGQCVCTRGYDQCAPYCAGYIYCSGSWCTCDYEAGPVPYYGGSTYYDSGPMPYYGGSTYYDSGPVPYYGGSTDYY